MPLRVIDLGECKGCGEPIDATRSLCASCGRPYVVSSFSDLAGLAVPQLRGYVSGYEGALQAAPDDASLHSALGIVFLKLGLYPKALGHFEDAMDGDALNSENHFYAACCVLGGNKPFLALAADVKQCERYLEAAIRLEPRGVYHLMLAYVAHDYYERKFLNRAMTYRDHLADATANNLTQADTMLLKEVLRQSDFGFANSR